MKILKEILTESADPRDSKENVISGWIFFAIVMGLLILTALAISNAH